MGDILSVSCRISLLDDQNRSVNIEIVSDENGNKTWEVFKQSTDSLLIPAPRQGTWSHGSPLPYFWLWIKPQSESGERALLYASGVPLDFFHKARCGGSLKAALALYYADPARTLDVDCEFSLRCV